jgi:hypothetical protein
MSLAVASDSRDQARFYGAISRDVIQYDGPSDLATNQSRKFECSRGHQCVNQLPHGLL